jgi:hypothetical protein
MCALARATGLASIGAGGYMHPSQDETQRPGPADTPAKMARALLRV